MPDAAGRPAKASDHARVLPVTPAAPPVIGVAGTASAHTSLADPTPLAAVTATVARIHGTVWPSAILLGLNLIAVVAAAKTRTRAKDSAG